MGPASIISGAGNTGSVYFISKIDLFGNMLWREGMNGAAISITPELTGYYLDAVTVLPIVRAGIDGKVYVVAAPGISVRTVSEDGDFENVKSIPVYQGSAYYQGMFFDTAGNMSIYGSTNGKIASGNGSYGLLDWFYLETDN